MFLSCRVLFSSKSCWPFGPTIAILYKIGTPPDTLKRGAKFRRTSSFTDVSYRYVTKTVPVRSTPQPENVDDRIDSPRISVPPWPNAAAFFSRVRVPGNRSISPQQPRNTNYQAGLFLFKSVLADAFGHVPAGI